MANEQTYSEIKVYYDESHQGPNPETFQNFEEFSLKQQDIREVKIYSPDSGIVNIDNGQRFEFGEAKQKRSWIVVQGLWMYFDDNDDFYDLKTPNDDNFIEVSSSELYKIYNNFVITKPYTEGQNYKILPGGNYEVQSETSSTNASYKYVILTNNNNYERYGHISNVYRHYWTGDDTATDPVDLVKYYGVFFQVNSISFTPDLQHNADWGYVEVVPRWVAYGCNNNNDTYYSLVTASSLTYKGSTGYEGTGRDTRNVTTVLLSNASAYKFKTMGYAPIGIENKTGYPLISYRIPFGSDIESKFAQGVTAIYTKKKPSDYRSDDNNE